MSSPKPVRCVETGEVFKSMGDAAASIGQLYKHSAPCHISHVVNGHREKAGGLHWEMIDGPISVEELVDGLSVEDLVIMGYGNPNYKGKKRERRKETFKEDALPKIYKEIKRQPPKQEKIDYPPEGYVYVFRNRWHPEGTYKIGSTDNLEGRRSAARTWGAYDCEFYLEVKDCKLVESTVHERLKDYRIEAVDLGQEHFSVDLDKAISIIKEVAFEVVNMHPDCTA